MQNNGFTSEKPPGDTAANGPPPYPVPQQQSTQNGDNGMVVAHPEPAYVKRTRLVPGETNFNSAQPTPNISTMQYIQQPTVITDKNVLNVPIIPLTRLGDEPDFVECPWCHKCVKTRVVKEDTGTT